MSQVFSFLPSLERESVYGLSLAYLMGWPEDGEEDHRHTTVTILAVTNGHDDSPKRTVLGTIETYPGVRTNGLNTEGSSVPVSQWKEVSYDVRSIDQGSSNRSDGVGEKGS